MEFIKGTFKKSNIYDTGFNMVNENLIESMSPALTEEIVYTPENSKYDEKDIEFDDSKKDTTEENSETTEEDSEYETFNVNTQIKYWTDVQKLVRLKKDILIDAGFELKILNDIYKGYCDKPFPPEIFESTIYFKYFVDKEVYYNNNIVNGRDILHCLQQNISYYQTLIKTGCVFTTLLAGYTAIMLFVFI